MKKEAGERGRSSKSYRPTGQKVDTELSVGRTVTFRGRRTRMRRMGQGPRGLARTQSIGDSNDSHDQDGIGICRTGRIISAPGSGSSARQNEAGHHEAGRHEKRKDAGRQDDARGHGKDSVYREVPWESTCNFGARDGVSRGGRETGSAADQLQDFERAGRTRDPGDDERRDG